jgi:hypothetical protein
LNEPNTDHENVTNEPKLPNEANSGYENATNEPKLPVTSNTSGRVDAVEAIEQPMASNEANRG